VPSIRPCVLTPQSLITSGSEAVCSTRTRPLIVPSAKPSGTRFTRKLPVVEPEKPAKHPTKRGVPAGSQHHPIRLQLRRRVLGIGEYVCNARAAFAAQRNRRAIPVRRSRRGEILLQRKRSVRGAGRYDCDAGAAFAGRSNTIAMQGPRSRDGQIRLQCRGRVRGTVKYDCNGRVLDQARTMQLAA